MLASGSISPLRSASIVAKPGIRCRQVEESDLPAAVDLLAKGFPQHRRQFWIGALARMAEHSTPPNVPRYGYLLESGRTPVGIILLIFSGVGGDGQGGIRCNLSSWYVDPAFRSFATSLVSQAVRLKTVTYLNITAAPHTRTMVEAQGFSRYSNGVFAAAPALSAASRVPAKVIRAEAWPDAPFKSFERDLLLDHAGYGCTSLWCVTAERAYPFVFRPRLAKGLVACTQLIYCHEIEDFVRFARPLGRYLAARGRPLVFVDANAPIPGLVGKYLDGRMPKFFRGPDRPRLGDLAYTEAALFGV
jgi:hypothetical protein